MIVCKKENVITDKGLVIREIIGKKEALGSSQRLSASRVDMKGGTSGGRHLHRTFDELYCVLSGSGHLTVGDGEVSYREGDFILVERGEPHFVSALTDSSFIVVCTPAWDGADCIDC